MDDRLRYGRCWWCGEVDSLFRLEGARLAGSPPLGLPTSIVTPDDRDAFRVCPGCAVTFGFARKAHDTELEEAGIGFRSVRVGDRVRRAIEGDHDAEGE